MECMNIQVLHAQINMLEVFRFRIEANDALIVNAKPKCSVHALFNDIDK